MRSEVFGVIREPASREWVVDADYSELAATIGTRGSAMGCAGPSPPARRVGARQIASSLAMPGQNSTTKLREGQGRVAGKMR